MISRAPLKAGDRNAVGISTPYENRKERRWEMLEWKWVVARLGFGLSGWGAGSASHSKEKNRLKGLEILSLGFFFSRVR